MEGGEGKGRNGRKEIMKERKRGNGGRMEGGERKRRGRVRKEKKKGRKERE